MATGTDRIVRNLYGHKNDGFSNPKVAWSSNGSVSSRSNVFLTTTVYEYVASLNISCA